MRIVDENDWVNAHIKKVKAIEDAKGLFNQLENDQKVDERIKKALGNLAIQQKRKLWDDQNDEEKDEGETDEVSHVNSLSG